MVLLTKLVMPANVKETGLEISVVSGGWGKNHRKKNTQFSIGKQSQEKNTQFSIGQKT